MYDQFYGFTERPFSLLPDPDFLFLGEKHRAALDTLELAIFNHSGFCVISGEIGAGKTTLVRELLNRLKDDIQVGLVSNTHPSFGELMQWIMAAYGLPGGTEDRLVLHKRFIDFVIQRYADGKHTLLIIDEAQNLSLAALEELRMLSNVNSEKDLVLQIILIGQSELRDNLRKPELAQFAQRISIDYFLGGLTPDETALYIQHRVTHAGGPADLFSADACREVFEHSQGIPRVINRLCDLSLVYGFAENLEQINADVVLLVAKEQHMGEAMEAARKRAADPAPAKKPLVTKAQVIDTEPESEPEPAPETLAETSNLHLELQAKRASKPKTNTRQDDLHMLVVNAEKTAGSRGERSALWLFVGVAVMVGAAGWVSRDAWLPTQQIASQSEQVTVEPSDKEAQAAMEKAQREETARLAEQEAAEKETLEQAKRDKADREKAERLVQLKAAEKAKLEQAALDKADQEKAASLAKQEAAKKAKLEQAKREKASKKKAVRLAKQKAAKKAKREKARRDKAARIAKQQAAEKAEREEAALLAQQKEQERREHAARALLGGPDWSGEDDEVPVNVPVVQSEVPAPQVKTFKKVDEKEQARRERAARAMLGSTADWSEEDDEELSDVPAAEPATLNPPETTTASATVASEESSEDIAKDADGFSSNPCDGPTARFLSTCH